MTLEERQTEMRERIKQGCERPQHAIKQLSDLLNAADKIRIERSCPGARLNPVTERDLIAAAFHAILRLADEPLEEYFPMNAVELLARLYKIGKVAEAALKTPRNIHR